MMTSRLFLIFAVAAASASYPVEGNEEVADYIHFEEGKAVAADTTPKTSLSDRLQTAVVRFERGSDSTTVDLVSVVHIGDADYYKKLNLILKNYDFVLYELVGGEFNTRSSSKNPSLTKDPDMATVQQAQGFAQQILQLDHQLESIDYEANNFIHADVSWEEFHTLMAAKNESMATLFQRAMKLAQNGELEGIPTSEADSNRMLIGILGSLASGDANSLKRTLAPVLSEAELLISKLEGEDGTVLVTGRNKVVMEKLNEVLSDKTNAGRELKIGVFYGAGHMPDLEERLILEKFEKKNVSWLTAWDIPQPGSDGNTPASSRFFQSLLDEKSGMLDILKNFGAAVNEAQRAGAATEAESTNE